MKSRSAVPLIAATLVEGYSGGFGQFASHEKESQVTSGLRDPSVKKKQAARHLLDERT